MNLRAKGAFPDFVPDNLKTNILTAIRTLWVESDRMATPAPAGPADVERGVFDGENGCVGCDDPIDFKTQTDISVLQPFVKQYLVDVKFIQNANPRTETSFIHNVLEPEKINQKGKDIRDVKSDESHWVVQVVHAYETQLEKDNDPNYQPQTIEHWSNWNNTWTLGYATGIGVDGTNWLYEEEIRDVFYNTSPPDGFAFRDNPRGIVTAHEILHRFFDAHNSNPNVNNYGIMQWKVALFTTGHVNDVLSMTPLQAKYLQTRKRPF